MSTDEGNRTPKMKRLLWTAFWLFWVAMIGASLTRDWLGFWPSMLIFGVLMVAVLAPLAFAAKRERVELEQRPNSSGPEAST